MQVQSLPNPLWKEITWCKRNTRNTYTAKTPRDKRGAGGNLGCYLKSWVYCIIE